MPRLVIVCYRLGGLTGESKYKRAGDKLVDALKTLQETASSNPALNGAIAGSFPLLMDICVRGIQTGQPSILSMRLLLQYRFTE